MQSMVMIGKIMINVSRKLKMSLYLETSFIFIRLLIIRNRRSICQRQNPLTPDIKTYIDTKSYPLFFFNPKTYVYSVSINFVQFNKYNLFPFTVQDMIDFLILNTCKNVH
jgi:hypothetical protein